MRKLFAFLSVASLPALAAVAQSVPVAYTMSQHDLRGTARFMSMGGAFGALGGDLTTLTQNPGGIGVYRSNDIGFTLGIDANSAKASANGFSQTTDMTGFNLNNIGGVFTMKLNNNVMPNLNIGFTYNKVASFNRKFKGQVPGLQTSLSNYIAGVSNANELTVADVEFTDDYDPYNPGPKDYVSPWISILGYDSYLTTPEGDPDKPNWYGQFGDGTTGRGYFEQFEKGSVDEYNIALGGNINNKVFWGMDFGITSIDYRIESVWGESLENAYVYNPKVERVVRSNADWDMYDNYRVKGTGFNFKLGVIVKPIQELRLGFAFHTPTYYNLDETYYNAHVNYQYYHANDVDRKDPFLSDDKWANDGVPAGNSFNFRTPWRLIASVAGVVGNNLIVSADYEWASYNGMRYSEATNYYGWYDPWYDWYDPWYDWMPAPYTGAASRAAVESDYMDANEYANKKIKDIYQNTNTFRIGAEYRVIPSFSVRAGYSWSSSPVKTEVKDYRVDVPGTGLLTSYTLGNITNHITCGVGYRHKGFYADLAYVYKYNSAEYFPFSPDLDRPETASKAKVSFDNSSIALTLGYKF